MKFTARLRCFAGCAGVDFELTEPVYRCPRCSALLDVVHDLDALASRPAAAWRELFAARRGKPGGSGVWDKKELVAPELDEAAIVSLGEGRSTLCPARRFGASFGLPSLSLKLCGNSHTGSFKDLGMTVLVSMVNGALRRGGDGARYRALGCASTGDTSAALAAYGAAAGLPVIVLLPRGKVSTAQLVQPIAAGARVFSLDGDFDACMKVIDALSARGVLYLANSMNALRLEGQKTVAFEIAEDLGYDVPDWVVIPSGNLGNGYAVYKGFAMLKALGLTKAMPRLALAQAERANPLYRAFSDKTEVSPVAAQTTLASAIQIGNPVSAPRALRALGETNGVVEQATEEELCDAAARADRTGLYVCPHTAVALAATEKLVRAGTIDKSARVVVVSTANALKFTEFKVRYHERAIEGVACRLANPPRELPADPDAVERAILASAV